MSSVEENGDLKAGHPPAVKAGGMRIAQHRKPGEKPPPASSPEEDEEFAEPTPTKAEQHNQQSLISGVITKGDRDFPADAIRQYHDKQLPTKEKPRPNHTTQRINQPR